MSEIRITPTAQLVVAGATLAAVAAAVAAQLPEVRRYLKAKSM